MTTAIGFILYHPTADDCWNICEYTKLYKQVYCYRNSEIGLVTDILSASSNITLLGDCTNNGLSIACNALCCAAKVDGCDGVLLLDQDSRLDVEEISKLENEFIKHPDIAIVCPRIRYEGEDTNIEQLHPKIEYVRWCITSGSLFNLKYLDNPINFDFNYFIDRVDTDISKQLEIESLKILRVNDVILEQKLGDTVTVFGHIHYQHSPLRHYYISRNRLYFNRKYHINFFTSMQQVLRHLFEILMFENKKVSKLKMFTQGVIDYRQGKFGKIDL